MSSHFNPLELSNKCDTLPQMLVESFALMLHKILLWRWSWRDIGMSGVLGVIPIARIRLRRNGLFWRRQRGWINCVLYRTQPTHSGNKPSACQSDAISSRIAQYENRLLDRWQWSISIDLWCADGKLWQNCPNPWSSRTCWWLWTYVYDGKKI